MHIIIASFVIFIGISALTGYEKGIQTSTAFTDVVIDMVTILPCAFILIALFETWVSRETVIAHLGDGAGFKSYIWAILLGGMSVGGIYVAFPLVYSLFRKGASLKIIFCIIGFAGACRIPMTIFEMSCLGWKFTFIRLTSAILMLLITGTAMGAILEKRNYQITEN